MTVSEAIQRVDRLIGGSDDTPRVWGMSARRLHDLFWAARGVQVVRPGQPPDQSGPRVYLLLLSDQAIISSAEQWIKRLAWLGCALMHVRVVDRSGVSYSERVITNDQGWFERIDRIYPRRGGRAGRAVVTSDAVVARFWSGLEPGSESWATLRRDARWRESAGVWSSEGRLFDLGDRGRRAALLGNLVQEWQDPGRVIPGIYQHKLGVWAQEDTTLAPTPRLVGPLWVGNVATVTGSEPVIGPLIIADERPPAATVPVDWERLSLPAFPLVPRIRRGLSRRASKRIFDIGFSLMALLLTLPLYPFIMLAIYLEDGRPFFFAHKRQTIAGRDFPCWKFRTMVKDAEKRKLALKAQNAADGPQFFMADDPRLLKTGRWLRRLQFDELPQFLNVLLGHMSVVGPRPSPDKENQFCPAWREARLSVRPGITGLWQVRRTRMPATDFQEWIRYDLEYVQHQSWRLDLWIILQTIRTIVGG
jgi:lipopolysaccharide/colanic/teichoic acid biosynthesis glycosyltransferase